MRTQVQEIVEDDDCDEKQNKRRKQVFNAHPATGVFAGIPFKRKQDQQRRKQNHSGQFGDDRIFDCVTTHKRCGRNNLTDVMDCSTDPGTRCQVGEVEYFCDWWDDKYGQRSK